VETSTLAIVGRDDELAEVEAFLDGPPPAALLLAGEAGIGKTTVWHAATEAAEARGFRVLRTRPAEVEAVLALAGVGDLLADVREEALAELPPPQRRALEVALLLENADGKPPDQRAVATAFFAALQVLARERPVAVAVDDVQWLDAPSRVTLAYSARRLRGQPLALIIARRIEPGKPATEVEEALEEQLVHHITLGPLSLGALHRLLQERRGEPLPRPLLRRIHELSGGNPFYAIELERSSTRGDELPPTLEHLVRGRLEALPDETRRALAVAAALAHPSVRFVGLAFDGDVLQALAPAVAAKIVALEEGAIRFAHPLLASGAYAGAGPAGQREFHVRLGRTLPNPEERARHLALATTEPDDDVATALDEAAARAAARGAPAAAAELSERAATLTSPEQAAEARRRRSDAAYFHFESGDGRRARALFEQLVEELESGAERALVLTRLALVRSYDDDIAAAVELFLAAAAEAGDDALVRARALEGAAANLFRSRRRFAEAVDHAKQAADLARAAGDDALLCRALGTQLVAEATLGREEAAVTLGQALAYEEATAKALEGERVMGRPKLTATVFRMWREELEQATRDYGELASLCRAIGDESSLPYVLILLAQAECYSAQFAAAAAHAGEALELAEQAGQETLAAYALAVGALVDAHRGREDDTRAAGERALELAERTSGAPALQFATTALGLLELSLGQAAAAAARLDPLVAFARAEDMREPGLTRFAIDHVEALTELSRLDEAEELLAWCEENAERLAREGALGNVLRCRGLLVAARGGDPLPIFERALAQHERSLLSFDRARTLLAYGAGLRRSKRKRDARAALEQALAEFERLDAAVFAKRAREQIARISGRTAEHDELTATERRVVELVAEGRTNREVAAAMFVSTKTIEFHLRNVFRKLGIRSRSQLARRI
jgi:DNA-binding CsgD family transcriptional regulator